MTLRIESLSLRNFRNYEDAALNELGDITVLVGENAVGKTNLIEAIQLLTALTSFRHGTADQLIRHGEEHSRVSMQATDGNRRLDIDLTLCIASPVAWFFACFFLIPAYFAVRKRLMKENAYGVGD